MNDKPNTTKRQVGTTRAKSAARSDNIKATTSKRGPVTAKKEAEKLVVRKPKTKKPVSVKTVARAKPAKDNLLRVGLGALTLPKAEFTMTDSFNKIADSFGLRKLEEVFDNRVAAALERIGIPPAAELRELLERMEELSKLIQAKKMKSRKQTPP